MPELWCVFPVPISSHTPPRAPWSHVKLCNFGLANALFWGVVKKHTSKHLRAGFYCQSCGKWKVCREVSSQWGVKQLGPGLFRRDKFASKQHCFDLRAAFSPVCQQWSLKVSEFAPRYEADSISSRKFMSVRFLKFTTPSQSTICLFKSFNLNLKWEMSLGRLHKNLLSAQLRKSKNILPDNGGSKMCFSCFSMWGHFDSSCCFYPGDATHQ